ncbi:hypothetical protein EMPG_10121 [Blastomyces silverae]|uniref:Uncharacterized protein n=1 Tax=Blastomyces silverae TaxID=2060906 RepID=A0A0H1BB83_9EURO|nr:hypothetical protein EMPG_10121 [Blastomyces silverae]
MTHLWALLNQDRIPQTPAALLDKDSRKCHRGVGHLAVETWHTHLTLNLRWDQRGVRRCRLTKVRLARIIQDSKHGRNHLCHLQARLAVRTPTSYLIRRAT